MQNASQNQKIEKKKVEESTSLIATQKNAV
jgi:hypothetical protein